MKRKSSLLFQIWVFLFYGLMNLLLYAQNPDPIYKLVQASFPECGIDKTLVSLHEDDVQRIEKSIRHKLSFRSVPVYRVKCQGGDKASKKSVRYIFPDTHIVRTKYETILVHISPEGKVLRVEVVFFQEPPEYEPSKRWLKVFRGKSISDLPLQPGIDVPNIGGATITANRITERVQIYLSLWNVMKKKIVFEGDKGRNEKNP